MHTNGRLEIVNTSPKISIIGFLMESPIIMLETPTAAKAKPMDKNCPDSRSGLPGSKMGSINN